MSTIPITSGRQFEFVSEYEWQRVARKRMVHPEIHQAIAFLEKEPVGTAVRFRCAAQSHKRKYAALKEARDRKGLNLETKWDSDWLYLKKLEG